MTYKLYIDDQLDEVDSRKTPSGFIGAKSSDEAWNILMGKGIPDVMDLDHDLHDGDSIRILLNRIKNEYEFPLPPPPKVVVVHSMNNVAYDWIVDFFKSWCNVFDYEYPVFVKRDLNT